MHLDGHADAYTQQNRKIPFYYTALLWVGWIVMTFLGFVGGELLGEMVQSALAPNDPTARQLFSMEQQVFTGGAAGYFAALAGAAVSGVVLGLAQSLFMLPLLKMAGALEWFAATFLGRAVRWIAIYVISRAFAGVTLDNHIVGVCLLAFWITGAGVISGLAIGYVQKQVLDRRAQHASRLMLAYIPGPVVAGVVMIFCLYYEMNNTIRDYATPLIALITAVSTGVALMDILRHPTAKAEWGSLFRRHDLYASGPQQPSVLGSTQYSSRESKAD